MRTNSALIYPYSRRFAPLLRHIRSFNIYNVVSVVVPGRCFGAGLDASYLDEGEATGIVLTCDFDYWMNKCDTIIWASYPYYGNLALYHEVLQLMEKALTQKKNIVCFETLTNDKLKEYSETARVNNCEFIYCTNDLYSFLNEDIGMSWSKAISIPIISISSMAEDCLKLHTELEIYRELSERGYKVSAITSRTICELLGVHSFPRLFFTNTYNEIEKIELFNKYIQYIIRTDKPDVLIIGVPGGFIPFDDVHHMHYGITAYEIFAGIKPDYNIVNIWADYLNNNIVTDLVYICKYRYGIKLNSLGVSNISIYNDHSTIEREYQEMNIYRSDEVQKMIESGKNHISFSGGIYNLINQKSTQNLVDDIISALTEK